MAITSSAKKAIRASERKAIFNLRRKRVYKDIVKEIDALLKQNKVAEAEKKVPEAYKAIDKAAKMRTIHKNAAARTKSRLIARIKKVKFAEKK
ncbi:MAG TPA: 30S ribosomal protein S20 [Candidatus Paceibacterota bacterium]|nr:30S ribosomal protein S20 [Candidatus Paceibacterota bacterium]HRZ34212.1 30S ribosomal protein S20 [Candidatus Paceibacterota bacterium]